MVYESIPAGTSRPSFATFRQTLYVLFWAARSVMAAMRSGSMPAMLGRSAIRILGFGGWIKLGRNMKGTRPSNLLTVRGLYRRGKLDRALPTLGLTRRSVFQNPIKLQENSALPSIPLHSAHCYRLACRDTSKSLKQTTASDEFLQSQTTPAAHYVANHTMHQSSILIPLLVSLLRPQNIRKLFKWTADQLRLLP